VIQFAWAAALKPLAACCLAGQEKRAGQLSLAAKLERPKVLVPVAVGYVGVLRLPISQGKQIFPGNLPFLGALAEMHPLFAGKLLPLERRHSSVTENESSKFNHHLVLDFGIVVSEILPELLEEFSLSSFLAFQAKANESDDRLAHAYVRRTGVGLNLPCDWRGKRHAIAVCVPSPFRL